MTVKQKKMLEEFKKTLVDKYKIANFDYFVESQHDLIYLKFPSEENEEIEFEFENLEKYITQLSTLLIDADMNKVSTDLITQRAVNVSDLNDFYLLLNLGLVYKIADDNIILTITNSPLLIGIAAAHLKEFDRYNSPCSDHIAVEVVYPDMSKKLSSDEEEKLIKIFFFELASIHKISFEFSTYKVHQITKDESDYKELLQSTTIRHVIPLEDYTYAMDLFVNANQKLSTDLKFLSYYKIFEFFAPVKAKIDAFDNMRLKLSSLNAMSPDANFISSVFELSRSYDKSIRDSELIKILIDNCFDLVDIYNLLPFALRKKMKYEKLSYASKSETKEKIVNELGIILYQTRNSIVHAKSNYANKGLECSGEDLKELNIFMHYAASSIIKWYNTLPKHLKLNVD